MKKIIEKKLISTKKKVSKEWLKYRKQKAKVKQNRKLNIFEKENIIFDLLGDTRKRISQDYAD